jgi:hypothetical protein
VKPAALLARDPFRRRAPICGRNPIQAWRTSARSPRAVPAGLGRFGVDPLAPPAIRRGGSRSSGASPPMNLHPRRPWSRAPAARSRRRARGDLARASCEDVSFNSTGHLFGVWFGGLLSRCRR